MDDITSFLIAFGIILFSGLPFYLLWRKHKNRVKELKIIASKIGLSYIGEQNNNERRSGNYYNEMEGVIDGIKWNIFDYSWTSGGRRNRSSQTQTVALVEINKNLPNFHLTNRILLNDLSLFTNKPIISNIVANDIKIKFEGHPEFSKKYTVRGKNKKAVKQLFNERIIGYFEDKPKKLIVTPEVLECNGRKLLYYKPGRTVKASKIESFIEEVKIFVTLFTKS